MTARATEGSGAALRQRPRLGLGLRLFAPLLAAGALATAISSPPAHADVIEIDRDGSIAIHTGPMQTTAAGASPLAHTAPAAGMRTSAAAVEARRTALAASLRAAGDEAALSPALVEAVAWAESRFAVDAVSPKGARGPMQLMPGTARELGVDPSRPAENVRGGAIYLKRMLATFDGDLRLALAAYNAGPDAVRRFGDVPPFPETEAYVAAVLDYMARKSSPPEETTR